MLFYLSLILAVIFVIAVWDWFSRNARLMRKIPGPKAWPIIGNSLHYFVSPDQIFLTQQYLQKKYGTFTQIHAMNVRIVNISNPEDVEIVMNEFITKSDEYQFGSPWLRDGLLISGGQKWHQRRKLLTKAFHFTILKKFVVTFKQETGHFMKLMEKETLKDKTDLRALLSPATLRIICDTSMGIALGEDEVAFKKYFNSIETIGHCFVTRMTNFLLHNEFFFNLTPTSKIQKHVLTHLHAFTENVIKNKRQLLSKENGLKNENKSVSDENNEKMAFLDLLLENEKAGLIDDEGIKEEVDTFMFAGFDTAHVTLSFFLMAIANEPAIQDKIYEELQLILGENEELPTMEQLNEMKYLECCIKESLRLYPSVPVIARKLTKETVLSGYTVPANTSCFLLLFDLHRRPELFPDPDRFDPDRFLPENSQNRKTYSYVPFSAGPRNCIGQKFAMLEMKMLLSGVLRKFRVEPVTKPSDLFLMEAMVLMTKNPMYVRFRLRK